MLDSIVMNLTFNTQGLQGSVSVHLRAIPNLTYEASELKLTGEHYENGRLVLIVSLRSFGILNAVGGVFSGARNARTLTHLTARSRGYHLGRVQMARCTFMGRASTAQALFVHRR